MSAYSSLLYRLFHANRWGSHKLGLQNMEQLQKLFDYPDRQFKLIHVAGTNGKGSVTTKIACALQQAGYRVGLYTSPHLSCFRERIRINGEMISEKDVEVLLSSLLQVVDRESIHATFFELTTFLAFLYFAQQKVDAAVLEVGLGGRLDATNIIHPCLSVITSISLDHTEVLGKTREKIAWEKGGIIKDHVPVVIGPHVPWEPIQQIADQKQSPCIRVQENSSFFEEENRLIARQALTTLSSHFVIPAEAIEKGLEGGQPCRFQILKENPEIILDVGHNPDGLKHLFQAIRTYYPERRLRLLFGLSKNKDLQGCLKEIAVHGDVFHLVEAANGRGASVDILSSSLVALGITPARVFTHDSVITATLLARKAAQEEGQLLVICGSFFIMGEARQALGFSEPRDPIDLNEAAKPLSKNSLSEIHR